MLTIIYAHAEEAMFSVLHLIQPDTLEEAYQALVHRRNNAVLGGCTFLRLGSRKIGTAIDLSTLGLRYIHEREGMLEIGAMATLRDLELQPCAAQFADGVLADALRPIIGVQFRNVATVGASVFSRYGFSDLITALLALETEVELYRGGRMPLETFLASPLERDILTKVIVNLSPRRGAYRTLRNAASDFPVLSVAASCGETGWRIAVGARPHCAALAKQAADFLNQATTIGAPEIQTAAELAATELSFGRNMRGSAEYRQDVCRTLAARAIEEVAACKSN